MSDFDREIYQAWEISTAESKVVTRLESAESLVDEARRIEAIEEPGEKLFELSILLDMCSKALSVEDAGDKPSKLEKQCNTLAEGKPIPRRTAFVVLQDAADLGHFPALLKLAEYDPDGIHEARRDARDILLRLTLDITKPAYDKLMAAAPDQHLHPKELESIGWIAIKNAVYGRLLDADIELFDRQEREGLALLLASRSMQPTQFIPESRHCSYLDTRMAQFSATEAMELEAMALNFIEEWSF